MTDFYWWKIMEKGIMILVIISGLIFKECLTYRLAFHDDIYKNLYSNAEEDGYYMENKMSDLPENGQLFEGDMIMDNRIRNAVLGRKRTAIFDTGKNRWENGIIVYVNNIKNEEGRNLLKKAMKEMEKRTCIRFRKRTVEKDYVEYTDKEDWCASNVGKTGGKQTINLGVDCNVLGTHLHETMHCLGFIHEHSRPDRDEHVNIRWSNIKKDDTTNFNKYLLEDTISDVPYNFASIMHYRNNAFTKNGDDTIVAKHDPELKFGQRIQFSVGDVMQINKLYNCPKNDNYSGLYKIYDEKMLEKKDAQRRRIKMLAEKIRDFKNRNMFGNYNKKK